MAKNLKVLVAGVGGMGASHTKGYVNTPGFEVVGLVVQKNVERAKRLAAALSIDVPISTDYYKAFAETKPDVVSINTLVDTHAAYSIHAMKAGCHVFMEKPIAKTVREAEQVVKVARADAAQARHRLHPARAPGLEAVHRAGADPRQAAGHAHEPEPAELRRTSGKCTRASSRTCPPWWTAACTTST